MYTVYHADRKLRGGRVLAAVLEAVSGAKHRLDLECFQECAWVQVAMTDNHNLLIGNHYFLPHVNAHISRSYFHSFRKYVSTLNYHVILIGDFNVLGLAWNCSLPFCNSHHYIKEKDVSHSATCFLYLNQHNNLPLELKNVSDFKVFKKKLKCYLVNSSFYSLHEFLCKKGK
jgi:hypothetical protein